MSRNLYTTQLCAGSFVLGCAITYQYLIHALKSPKEERQKSVKTSRNHDVDKTERQLIIPPEMRAEQLSRNELYFGKEGQESIQKASILIVGLGGVGSHTAHMLARAGVGEMRFVDFDQVTLSSLNRHACATLEDVGIPKVECLKRFLSKVCGSCCKIDAWVQMYTGDPSKDGDMLTCPQSGREWDIVIDAIDDVTTKAKLLSHCLRNNIKIISCMGAGGKSDMTRLHISDLKTASRDPLATKLRQTLKKMLKKDMKDDSYLSDVDKLAVIYNSEKVVCKLADFTEEQREEGIQKFGAVDNMRIRIIPVLGTMPAIMGQSLAAWALCEIGGKPFKPLGAERLGRNARNRLYQHFNNRENKMRKHVEERENYTGNSDFSESTVINGSWLGPPQIDIDDVDFIVSEVWRNRCFVSGDSIGSVLEICRWDIAKPSTIQNIVLLSSKALRRFQEEFQKSGDGRNCISEEIRMKIEARLESSLA